MALIDQVKLRVPARRLNELTNRDDNTGTASNDTVLAQACTDITAAFATYAGSALDTSVTEHLRIATDGVVAILRKWASGDEDAWEKWKTACKEYALTSARDLKSLKTGSPLTPTDEASESGAAVTGWSDPDHFEGYTPNGP